MVNVNLDVWLVLLELLTWTHTYLEQVQRALQKQKGEREKCMQQKFPPAVPEQRGKALENNNRKRLSHLDTVKYKDISIIFMSCIFQNNSNVLHACPCSVTRYSGRSWPCF